MLLLVTQLDFSSKFNKNQKLLDNNDNLFKKSIFLLLYLINVIF